MRCLIAMRPLFRAAVQTSAQVRAEMRKITRSVVVREFDSGFFTLFSHNPLLVYLFRRLYFQICSIGAFSIVRRIKNFQ